MIDADYDHAHSAHDVNYNYLMTRNFGGDD